MTGGAIIMIICGMIMIVMVIPSSLTSLQYKSHGIQIDEYGVPYVNYDERESTFKGIGVQRNPVTIIHTAMDYYNVGNTEYFTLTGLLIMLFRKMVSQPSSTDMIGRLTT